MPREMTAKEQRYWEHMLSGDPVIGSFIKNQTMYGNDPVKTAMRQPICPRCEKFAFHHQNGVQCPSCGHWSPMKTHSIKVHLKEGHYR